MTVSVNVTIQSKRGFYARRFLLPSLIVNFIFLSLTPAAFLAQSNQQTVTIQPFVELLKRPVNLRPELKNVHPRLFFAAADLPKMRERAKGADAGLWQMTLKDIQTLRKQAPDPKDEDLYKSGLDERKKGSISQYTFAFQIAQTAYAYSIEQDEKYLDAAKKWTLAACEMPIWGYTYNKPNVDLPPAHLLYAVAFSYDVLYDRLTKEERETIKNKLVKQGRLMYDYFKYKDKKRYTYSQNHTWIPIAGLAIAAYAIMDEVPEAKDWAQLSRAVFDRTMLTFADDGYFYESFHYFGFAFRWMIRYFDAHKQITGENLYEPMREKFANLKYFAMHSILPDRENVFDFADVGDGSLNRNGTSKRETLYGEYDIMYRFAGVYQDGEAQTVGDFIRTQTKLETREPMWAFINHDANLQRAPLSQIPLQVYFPDNDTAFWRSSWEQNATAFAFRCAPPEGHRAARLSKSIPDWRQNEGHAHPDANSFIIFANGKYLTGDTGYLGIKNTDDHNTILVNNRGQANDGVYEMFKEVPQDRLDKVRIADIWATRDFFYARGEAASGYYGDLGLKKFDRNFLYVAPDYFVVWDELQTDKPSDFSFLLNADREIKLDGAAANLINETAALRVVRVAPNDATSKVVPQMVQARGLPGSVDEGDSEQRGEQLQTVSMQKQTNFEFLHFLQPYSVAGENVAPKISALSGGAKGLKIDWASGAREFVLLRGSGENVQSDAARIVLRETQNGDWTRLIWQNGKQISESGRTIMQAAKPVSGSFNAGKNGKFNGYISAGDATAINLALAAKPKAILINRKAAKFDFDEKTKSVKFELSGGKNLIEIQ